MSRIIKFRGKRIDGGCWVYGNYIKVTPYKNNDGHKICSQDTWDMIDVIPETVGQFTNMSDKNGKEIYEGDIVLSGMDSHDEWIPSNAIIKWDAEWAMFVQYLVDGRGEQMMDVPTEIIGNIHDNPELMEVEK